MLDWMFVLLFALALLFMLIAAIENMVFDGNYPFWGLASTVMSITIWFMLGLGVLRMETEYVIYNVTSEQIESGLHAYTPVTNVFISYLFMYGFTGILMIYLVIRAYEEYKILKNK